MEILYEGLRKTSSYINDENVCDGTEEFSNFYNKWRKGNPQNLCNSIPKFYEPIPEDPKSLQWNLREEARSVFLKTKNESLLSNEELKTLLCLLERKQNTIGKSSMTYGDLKEINSQLGTKFQNCLTALAFAKLINRDSEEVSTVDVFSYAMKKMWLQQTRIGLSLYDFTGQGYLRENDLESYVLDLIPTLTQLDGLEKSFYSFYSCTAARKFMFFLDPKHTGRVRIKDILISGFLDELLELRDDSCLIQQESNWFSAHSTLRVYGQYLYLDTDHNGMLSKSELAKFSMGTLTGAFLNSLFQECLTYGGEMDYRSYLDFILAFENSNEPQSLRYFFNILDINGRGYLDSLTLKYFVKSVQDKMKEFGCEAVLMEDVVGEIFDIVKPIDPLKITLKDLTNCELGGTFIKILIDVNGFWNYENRESNDEGNTEEKET